MTTCPFDGFEPGAPAYLVADLMSPICGECGSYPKELGRPFKAVYLGHAADGPNLVGVLRLVQPMMCQVCGKVLGHVRVPCGQPGWRAELFEGEPPVCISTGGHPTCATHAQ